MCQHIDGRLVVDLSYDIRSDALTWVLTGVNPDGQAQWLHDGHAPLRTASPALMRALHDAVAGSILEIGSVTQPFDG